MKALPQWKDTALLLAIYSLFLLLPWYKQYSGQLQPVDGIVMLAAILLIFHQPLQSLRYLKYSSTYVLMAALGFYLILRYAIAFTSNHNTLSPLLSNIYYLSLLTFFSFTLLYLYTKRSATHFYYILLNALFFTTFIPLTILIVFGKNYGLAQLQQLDAMIYRPILSFNNANQLGFFALINLSIFTYLTLFANQMQIRLNKVLSLFIININLIFLFLSMSRATSPAIFLYFLAYPLMFKPESLKKRPFLIGACILLATALWFALISFYHHYLMPAAVVASTHNKGGFIQDFYLRAIQGVYFNLRDISYALFGYGSLQNPERPLNLEFHNNFFSLFNQGGILALSLYILLMVNTFTKLFKKGWVYITPLACYLFYSQMHYAYRTRLNWLFFAMIIFILLYEHINADKKQLN